MTNVLRSLEQVLFPSACVLCGAVAKGTPNLCCACRRDLPRLQTACVRCAEPLATTGLCGRCLRSPPPVERTLSAFVYAGYVPYLVQQLKFSGSQPVARLLGELLYDVVSSRPGTLPQAVVPVPLHRERLRARGFNQALEIARTLRQKLGLPLVTSGVQRLGSAVPQTLQKTAAERRRNVRGVFEVSNVVEPYQSVAIVDDVMTSGATAFSLAAALRARAVARIEVWTVARARGHG